MVGLLSQVRGVAANSELGAGVRQVQPFLHRNYERGTKESNVSSS